MSARQADRTLTGRQERARCSCRRTIVWVERRQAYAQFVNVSRWAQRELKFASASSEAAARAERHAWHGPPAVQKEWAELAALERRNQRRHLAAARLHLAHAKRLNRTAGRPARSPVAVFAAAVADVCGTGSVVVTLAGSHQFAAVVTASDDLAQSASDLELLYGEGPGQDAAASAEPVHAAGAALVTAWPRYGAAVTGLGVHTVAAAALSHAGRSHGTLSALYPRRSPPAETVPIRSLAEALTQLLLASNPAVGRDGLPPVPLLGGAGDHLLIHQAAGMVAAQASVDTSAALALIRARAFADSQPAETIAAQVVSRRLDLMARD